VGIVSVATGCAAAWYLNRRSPIPLRPTADFSAAQIEAMAARDAGQLPPCWLAVLPILLPVLLIAGRTVLQAWNPGLPEGVYQIALGLGHENLALGLAAAVALGSLVWQQRMALRAVSAKVEEALAGGGGIILITAAGGALGSMLQQTGVGSLIQAFPGRSPLVVLTLAFLVTTAIRTAQGSATVAMITAVGLLSGLAASGQLGCHPVYLALAIACGSKPIMWMNDSGFWVMSKLSGLTEAETLRTITPLMALMGVTGLAVTLLAAWLIPL
jgi:GntP family gluconate:H+ symporter